MSNPHETGPAGRAFTRAGLAVLWLVSRLPWSWQRRLAVVAGWMAYRCLPLRRHVVRVNLRICFPELGEAEREALAIRHYQSLVLGALEVARCWWRGPAELPPCRVEGLEALERLRAEGRPVLLVSGHFTTLEIAGRMLSLRTPLSCLYRDPNNAVLAGLLRRHRTAWTHRAISMNDLMGLLRALRQGDTVWYAPDQGKWTPQSRLLPFFGRDAITNTATAKLAQMSGAAVMTFFPVRLEDGSYALKLDGPLEGFPSGDAEADTRRLTGLLEDAVRAAPDQYLWVHRRFKGHRGLPVSPY
ncbi:MAG: lipid A biosynthesis acyltransferase [Verrucomicrobia bacterium]|nr:lipid A biosynthesis acyltransferase [Verrucomicrobiota bacterium]